MAIQILMFRVKETKNCWRYEPPASDGSSKPPVDCIYLQKSALDGKPAPERVMVEVKLI